MELAQLIAGALPVLAVWIGFFVLVWQITSRRGAPDFRLCWMIACVAWGSFLVGVVEISSAFRSFAVLWVVTAWSVAAVALLIITERLARGGPRGSLSSVRSALNRKWTELALFERVLIWITAMFAWLFLVIALATPSTNWDSLTYHLPRVMHWIQQQGVQHYPTGNTRQLEFGPWGGFAIGTLYLLQGSDRWANLPQWFAMLTTLIVSARLAQQLEAAGAFGRPLRKAGVSPAILAPLLVVTLPIGIVESFTTQTDYLVACWFVMFLSFGFDALRRPNDWLSISSAALALALGLLTKATMFIFVAPAGALWLVWWCCRLRSARLRVAWLAIFVFTLLAINAPHSSRNAALFGSPLGSQHIFALERNARLSAGTILSNAIRNLTLHTNTGFTWINRKINRALLALHGLTGQDAQDPQTTYVVGAFRVRDRPTVVDSYASNFYHLVVFGSVAAFASVHARRCRGALAYALLLLLSFLLFCAYVRWSFWHSRIHLAYFAALAPWAAVGLVQAAPRAIIGLATVAVTLFGGYSLVANRSRPVLDAAFMSARREVQTLWVYQPLTLEQLDECARDVVASGCQAVALTLDFDAAEYPIWLWLQKAGFSGKLMHSGVTNESAMLAGNHGAFCAWITTATNPPATAHYPYQLQYGDLTAFFAPEASYWSELAYFSPDRASLLPAPAAPADFQFQRRILTFFARVPRSGRLSIRGRITGAAGAPQTVDIRAEGGLSLTWASPDGMIAGEIPLAAGRTRINIIVPAIVIGNAPVVLRLMEWRWQPMVSEQARGGEG